MRVEIKERIIEGAYQLFSQRGLKSVTMDDIARHLHVSKKTIYKYFREKDEIVEAFTLGLLKQTQSSLDEIAAISKDPIEEILLIMKHLATMFSTINTNLIYDLQKYYPKVWIVFKEFKDKNMIQMVENNLRKGIKQGLYREKLDVKILARLRMAQVELAMNPLVFSPQQFDFAKVQLTLIDHFLHGITTLKGHKLINKYNKVVEEE